MKIYIQVYVLRGFEAPLTHVCMYDKVVYEDYGMYELLTRGRVSTPGTCRIPRVAPFQAFCSVVAILVLRNTSEHRMDADDGDSDTSSCVEEVEVEEQQQAKSKSATPPSNISNGDVECRCLA